MRKYNCAGSGDADTLSSACVLSVMEETRSSPKSELGVDMLGVFVG